jgi:DNA-binding response OmpR family regulator
MATILMIDDDAAAARQLATALAIEGIETQQVTSALEALEVLERGPADLVLLELMLPGINGIELARMLRARYPELRIVLTGSYHLSERQLRNSECGALAFVPKPFEPTTVAGFLRSKIPSSPPSSARLSKRP